MKRWKLLFMLLCGFALGLILGLTIENDPPILNATVDRIESEIVILEIEHGPNSIVFVDVPADLVVGEVSEGSNVTLTFFAEVQ